MDKSAGAVIIHLADARKNIFDRIDNPAAGHCAPNPAPPAVKREQPAARENSIAMRGGVRAMLVMATEGAFDLRAGYPDSPYLDRFEARFEQLDEALAAVAVAGADDVGADSRFLVNRARTSLAALHDTVRREIVENVNRDIDIPSFDNALDRVRDAAIAAGAVAGSLEIALGAD